jgi:oxygen-independent coproporphyrinogen-3 oxidase
MDDAFAVYVHWPFCVAKCPYCDFNSHVRERVDEAGWRTALLAELDFEAARTRGRTVGSVFFGGGTPSLMAPETVAAVLERVAGRWTLAPDAEITLEANPNSAEAAKFRALAGAGVNRVSIGVQALDDEALHFLGRAHDAREGRAAVEAARGAFARVSFDLIYARPGQSPRAWAAELDEALAMAGEHLSLYQLTIEPGTRFAQLAARGELETPDAETATALWETTQERLARAGMPADEISSHARPGAESRHNLVYWRYQDHVGVGPGAHGRRGTGGGKLATRRERAPETWLARVAERGHGMAEEVAVAPADAAREALVMGLRLAEGIDAARFRRETGVALDDALDPRGLARALDGGFVRRDGAGGIAATPAGRRVLDSVLAEISR